MRPTLFYWSTALFGLLFIFNNRSTAQVFSPATDRPTHFSSGAGANVQTPPNSTKSTVVPSSTYVQSAFPNGSQASQAPEAIPSMDAQVPPWKLPESTSTRFDARNVVPAVANVPNPSPSSASTVVSSGSRTDLRLRPRTTASEQNSERPKGGFLQMFMSVGSSLVIVIGLFLGVAWCYRRAGNTNLNLLPKHVVSILGRSALAPRQQLVLLRFGPKLVLVNLSQGDARTISEISDPIEVDRLAGLCESARPGSISESFRNVLFQTGKEHSR